MNYIFSIKSAKYGIPAGTGSMPTALTDLGNTVKGSVTIDEAAGTETKFWEDQKSVPIRVVKTDEGELSATMQFYDIDFTKVGDLKGGIGNASGWAPATGFTQVSKAFEIVTDSGHKLEIYNGSVIARITGGGGRDKMFSLEVKVTPQQTADGLASYKWSPTT
jgi:hypothetical protein